MKAEKRQKHGSRPSTTTIDNKSKGRNQGDKRPKDSKVNYIKSMKVKKSNINGIKNIWLLDSYEVL